MALAAGVRLGPYKILSPLGAGGMGEVYRARDTKLNRDVALKVLPDAFLFDPDRLARFKREAQLLASLNHPQIAAIYGLEEAIPSTGEQQPLQAIVLELVEGDTLADRIARGPIPFDEAFPIARQVADALEAAHEQGVIHRDLKPANIKIRPDGAVKVLDFGLAKAVEAGSGTRAGGSELTVSPTITSPAMTQLGVVIGTAAYMSPEQAKGRAADKRSDIWAFGCVVFEMLTGRRVFDGDDVSEALAFVITKEPDWAKLPEGTPASIRTLLRRCLEKDRRKRLADVADARLEIDEAGHGSGTGAADPTAVAGAVRPWKTRAYAWLAATVLLAATLAIVLAIWAPWRQPAAEAPLRVTAELGADVSVVNQGSAIVISPDGALLAFVAPNAVGGPAQLYVRRLGQLQATAIAGTTGARNPFFSPDGQEIAFFADDKLKKVSAQGGPVMTLCEARDDRGGGWAEDGSILFAVAATPLFRVSSSGGKPQAATQLADGETTQRWPQVLPGGKAVLFTAHNTGGDFDRAHIVVQTLPDGARRVVQREGYFGRYLPTGHLIYMHEGTLFATRFDLDRLEVAGQPVPLLEGIAAGPTGVGANGAAQLAVSNTGTLVYLPGASFVGSPMDWMDRAGNITPLRRTPVIWRSPSFSPDGQRLAFDTEGQADLWIYEWARETLTRLTSGAGEKVRPIWTPDGRRIAFGLRSWDNALISNLYWQRSDGAGEPQRLTESKSPQFPSSWHPTGKFLAFQEVGVTGTSFDLMILPVDGDETSGWKPGKPTIFLSTPFAEIDPMFSPDGRWLAYASNESGRFEVYVRPFSGSGGKTLISTGGGDFPVWSPARRELLYYAADQRIMVTPYTTNGDSFVPDKPRPWSDQHVRQWAGRRGFALHPDGDRIAFPRPWDTTAGKQDKVVFVFNFFNEIRRLAPASR